MCSIQTFLKSVWVMMLRIVSPKNEKFVSLSTENNGKILGNAISEDNIQGGKTEGH